jgi:D-alanyl-D-alanine carboxypeptidase (penicillin-binding protein 5/6)
LDFSDINKRKYRKKKEHGPPGTGMRAVIALIALVAVCAAAYIASDLLRDRKVDKAVEKAAEIAEEEANSVKASVNLAVPLHSAYYILLQMPSEKDGYEKKASWADLPSKPGDVEKKPYLHNQILMEKSPDEKMYPASMTKILTAITVLENIPDLDKKVTLIDRNFHHYYSDGATIAGYRAGDRVSLRDLLCGLMLVSGSECAAALAEETAGNEEAFVALMNEKAAEIGMTASRFANPVGLHDENNYSTVSDIAMLLDYALQNRTFVEIFTSQEHVAEPTGSFPDGLTMRNHIFREELAQNANATGDEVSQPPDDFGADPGLVLGGKTGYVDESGQCLASLLSKGGVKFILVTAAAMPENSRTQFLHAEDMRAVLASIRVSSS